MRIASRSSAAASPDFHWAQESVTQVVVAPKVTGVDRDGPAELSDSSSEVVLVHEHVAEVDRDPEIVRHQGF